MMRRDQLLKRHEDESHKQRLDDAMVCLDRMQQETAGVQQLLEDRTRSMRRREGSPRPGVNILNQLLGDQHQDDESHNSKSEAFIDGPITESTTASDEGGTLHHQPNDEYEEGISTEQENDTAVSINPRDAYDAVEMM